MNMSKFMYYVTYGLARGILSEYDLPEGAVIAFYIVSVLTCIIVPYLLGQLNFAIILSKKLFGVDVREYGSGNGGATNMLRTFGKKAGIVTLLGDMGKAVVSCIIGYLLLGRIGAFIAGFFCILGHTMPIKYKFKGGKGVACAAAVILMTDLGNMLHIPIVFLILLLCFAVIALGLKYVSLASVMCMLIYPLIMYQTEMIILNNVLDTSSPIFGSIVRDIGLSFLIAFMMAILVIFMHRENIKRLLHGKESKLDLKGKKKTLYEESKAEKSNESDEK